MARVPGVSKAGYYAWRCRPPSAHAEADRALLKRIRTIHVTSHATYGVPRVHAELLAGGEKHGRKRIAGCCVQPGWLASAGAAARLPRRGATRRPGLRRGPPLSRGQALVEQNFPAFAPNQLWVADITFIPTAAGFRYLAVVPDAFSRRVVGWPMANHLRAGLVLDALAMAVGQRQPADVIHHSDRGSQYTSLAFGGGCREAGVRPSMGSAGDA